MPTPAGVSVAESPKNTSALAGPQRVAIVWHADRQRTAECELTLGLSKRGRTRRKNYKEDQPNGARRFHCSNNSKAKATIAKP